MFIKKQKTIGVIVKVFESEGMISQVHVITFKIEMNLLTTNSKTKLMKIAMKFTMLIMNLNSKEY